MRVRVRSERNSEFFHHLTRYRLLITNDSIYYAVSQLSPTFRLNFIFSFEMLPKKYRILRRKTVEWISYYFVSYFRVLFLFNILRFFGSSWSPTTVIFWYQNTFMCPYKKLRTFTKEFFSRLLLLAFYLCVYQEMWIKLQYVKVWLWWIPASHSQILS